MGKYLPQAFCVLAILILLVILVVAHRVKEVQVAIEQKANEEFQDLAKYANGIYQRGSSHSIRLIVDAVVPEDGRYYIGLVDGNPGKLSEVILNIERVMVNRIRAQSPELDENLDGATLYTKLSQDPLWQGVAGQGWAVREIRAFMYDHIWVEETPVTPAEVRFLRKELVLLIKKLDQAEAKLQSARQQT